MVRESKETVQSVDRALRILECFTMGKSELVLSEIAQMTALSKSTVFRLLATMAGNGYIKQDRATQKYSLGFKLFRLGAVVVGDLNLRRAALPFMKQLCNEISETIVLNIVEGDQRVCIEIVESPEIIRNFVKVGQRNNLCVGASGRAMLAYLPEAEIRNIIAEAEKMGILPMGAALLKKELEHIRQQGFTFVSDSRIQGSFSIAAPIFDYTGKLAGSISAAGPTQRLTEERIPYLIERLIHAAGQISETVGYSDVIKN